MIVDKHHFYTGFSIEELYIHIKRLQQEICDSYLENMILRSWQIQMEGEIKELREMLHQTLSENKNRNLPMLWSNK
jgi:hypothetical protein